MRKLRCRELLRSYLEYRDLLALARLKLGRFSDAMDAYSNIQVARGALTPSALAVHAAVLAATGHADDAAAEVRDVDPKRLLPEEAGLIETIKAKSKVAVTQRHSARPGLQRLK